MLRGVFVCSVYSRVGLNPDLVWIFMRLLLLDLVMLRVESQNSFEFRVNSVSEVTGLVQVIRGFEIGFI